MFIVRRFMKLIVMLLGTVSILTILSGAIVFFGASKGDKIRSFWFFAAAIFATFWMSSIMFFMAAKPEKIDTIGWHVNWTFVSAILIDVAFLGYTAWRQKYGKPMIFFFLIYGLIISALILFKPDLLYEEILLQNTGNSVKLRIGPLYFAYNAFFALIVPAIVIAFLRQYFKSSSKRKKGSDLVIAISFGISSLLTLIFNLVFPLFDRWELIWIGPLALAVTIIAFYYSILRYRSLNLSSIWLKIFSYIVIIASIAIIYMIIFYVIFAALFRGSTPSAEVILLNFILILIFISLMPAMNTSMMYIRSLISGPKTEKGDK